MSELIPKRPLLTIPESVHAKAATAQVKRAVLAQHLAKTKQSAGLRTEVHAR
jgi:hypothetical protein